MYNGLSIPSNDNYIILCISTIAYSYIDSYVKSKYDRSVPKRVPGYVNIIVNYTLCFFSYDLENQPSRVWDNPAKKGHLLAGVMNHLRSVLWSSMSSLCNQDIISYQLSDIYPVTSQVGWSCKYESHQYPIKSMKSDWHPIEIPLNHDQITTQSHSYPIHILSSN